jgi:hypothetical protein
MRILCWKFKSMNKCRNLAKWRSLNAYLKLSFENRWSESPGVSLANSFSRYIGIDLLPVRGSTARTPDNKCVRKMQINNELCLFSVETTRSWPRGATSITQVSTVSSMGDPRALDGSRSHIHCKSLEDMTRLLLLRFGKENLENQIAQVNRSPCPVLRFSQFLHRHANDFH